MTYSISVDLGAVFSADQFAQMQIPATPNTYAQICLTAKLTQADINALGIAHKFSSAQSFRQLGGELRKPEAVAHLASLAAWCSGEWKEVRPSCWQKIGGRREAPALLALMGKYGHPGFAFLKDAAASSPPRIGAATDPSDRKRLQLRPLQ